MIKVLGKIELPQRRESMNVKSIRERATREMKKNQEANIQFLQTFFEKMGAPKNFLTKEGGIDMNIFREKLGGVYKDSFVDDDIRYTNIQNERVFHKKEMELRDGPLSEKLIPILFNKLLKGSDYIVVSTSLYDDNSNGVDQVIMNVKTGETICAIDDFVANDDVHKTYRKGERRHDFQIKVERFIQKRKNGMRLKYGAIFKDHQFQKLSKLQNLPFLIFKIERKHFYRAMEEMDYSIESEVGEKENELLHYMLQSMEEQIPLFSEKVNVSYNSVRDFVEFLKTKIT